MGDVVLLAVAVAALIAVPPFLLRILRRRRHWKIAARLLGLEAEPTSWLAGPRLRGTVQGMQVVVGQGLRSRLHWRGQRTVGALTTGQSLATRTEVRVAIPPLSVPIQVTSRERGPGRRALELAADEVELDAALHPDWREHLQRFQRSCPGFVLTEECVLIPLADDRDLARQIRRAIQAAVQLHEQLRAPA
jgi:hypothetical protein